MEPVQPFLLKSGLASVTEGGPGPTGGRQVAQLRKEMGSRCHEPDGTFMLFNEHAVNLAHFRL